MKKASHRTNAAGFHLQEVSEVTELTEIESQTVVRWLQELEEERNGELLLSGKFQTCKMKRLEALLHNNVRIVNNTVLCT